MLQTLRIRNYALIDSLDLEFGPGLSIITGETGAGKSIMLGALSLLMGGRADTRVISDAAAKSVVEAGFSDVDPALAPLFEERGLEWSAPDGNAPGEIVIRREISGSGRSKVYINDTAVTLQTLSAIAPRLIDIHSQHANAEINSPAMRLEIIDAMAGNAAGRDEYLALYRSYVSLRRRINSLKEAAKKIAENEEFLRFRLEGLEKLRPKTGELAQIERRYEMLSDADDIKEHLCTISSLLGDNGRGALSCVGDALSEASKLDLSLFGESAQFEARLKALAIELKDLCDTAEAVNSEVDTDPGMLSRLSDRMNAYYDAVRRYKVEDADSLVTLYDELKAQLVYAAGGDDEIPRLEKEARATALRLKEAAVRLTESRREAATRFAATVEETARPLGLPNVRFEVDFTETKMTPSGKDAVDFLCSFNKNGVPGPVSKIASGGEISRMMLSIKSILAGNMHLPTIIFDEVDTGISGGIADRTGAMMQAMGLDMQVIVITHLPQVAAKGVAHYKVYKRDEGERTVTRVRVLTDEERVSELAGMISGASVTPEALSAARALLSAKS